MCFGSEEHRGECRTTEDVRRLFERYRAEARAYAELAGETEPAAEPVEPTVETEPLVTAH